MQDMKSGRIIFRLQGMNQPKDFPSFQKCISAVKQLRLSLLEYVIEEQDYINIIYIFVNNDGLPHCTKPEP